jgi:phospholipase D1/2
MTALLDQPGTCWCTTEARRAALLIDGAAYFAALHDALLNARESVLIIGWDVNSDISLNPTNGAAPLKSFLNQLLKRRRELNIRLLIWDWVFIYGLDRQFLPRLRFGLGASRRLKFQLDSDHPPGACQHEKLVVIDGELAFCGGIDLTVGRWDTPAHRPEEPHRQLPDGTPRPPFHDCMLMVEGETARALDELARERWRRASGERVAAPTLRGHSLWPETVEPWFENVRVGIARTRPQYDGLPAVREVEALYLRSIRAAERAIYIENQYLTVTAIAESIAARLEEREGPEALILGPTVCEGPVETAVMDRGRARFLKRLRAADRSGERVRAFYPVNGDSDPATPINLHAKLMVVDDRLLVIGSANLANRSMGLDTECVLALEAFDAATSRAVRRVRDTLLAEHLGEDPDTVEEEHARQGSLIRAVEALNGGQRRLEPLVVEEIPLPPEVEAGFALTDLDEAITIARLEQHLAPLPRRRRLRNVVIRSATTLVLLLAFALLLRVEFTDGSRTVAHLLHLAAVYRFSWIGASGVLLTYAVGSLLFVPINLLIAATGAAFGPLLGLGYAAAGSLLAAAVVFGLGRAVGRDPMRRLAGRWVDAVSRRLDRHGLLAMALLRLMPVAPFSVVNLVAGSSSIRFRDFVFGSAIGMLPGLVLMTVFGDRLGAWLRRPDPFNLAILIAVTLGVVALAVALRRWSRRRRAE